jgi:hypothetical protein
VSWLAALRLVDIFSLSYERGLVLKIITTTRRAAVCVDRSCPDKRSEALLAPKIQNISKSKEECGKTGVQTILQDKKLLRK